MGYYTSEMEEMKVVTRIYVLQFTRSSHVVSWREDLEMLVGPLGLLGIRAGDQLFYAEGALTLEERRDVRVFREDVEKQVAKMWPRAPKWFFRVRVAFDFEAGFVIELPPPGVEV